MDTATFEELSTVTGGSPAVPQWNNYLFTQVMPVLNGLICGASAHDKNILNSIYTVLQGTAAPSAMVADTVTKLWTTYNTDYCSALQSGKIQLTLDQTLYGAKQYIDNHRL